MSIAHSGIARLKAEMPTLLKAINDLGIVGNIAATLEFVVQSDFVPEEVKGMTFERSGTPEDGYTIATDAQGNKMVILYRVDFAEHAMRVDTSYVVEAGAPFDLAAVLASIEATRPDAIALGEDGYGDVARVPVTVQ